MIIARHIFPAAIALTLWAPGSALAQNEDRCAAAAPATVRDFDVRPGQADEIATKLVNAGLFGQARALIAKVYGEEVEYTPDAILTVARSYRLQATDLAPARGTIALSEIAAARLGCLEEGDLFLERALDRQRAALSGETIDTPSSATGAVIDVGEAVTNFMAPLSAEARVVLFGMLSLERAELQLATGDFHFARAPVPFLSGRNALVETGAIALGDAMTAYRAARIALAHAEGARPKAVTDDHGRARRARLTGALEARLRWLAQGRAFGGQAYLRDTPAIGLTRDEAGLALSGRLSEALKRMLAREETLRQRMKAARSEIHEGTLRLSDLDREQATLKAQLRTELFQEMTALESREGTHDTNIRKILAENEVALSELHLQHSDNLDAIIQRLETAKADARSEREDVVAALTALAKLAPWDDEKSPLAKAWGEIGDEAAAQAETEAANRRAANPDGPDIDPPAYLPGDPDGIPGWFDKFIIHAGARVSRETSALAHGPAVEAAQGVLASQFAGGDTEWEALGAEIEQLGIERERLNAVMAMRILDRTLNVEELETVDLSALQKELEGIAQDKLELAGKIAQETWQGGASDTALALIESEEALIDDAVNAIQTEINRVQGLIQTAKDVLTAVEEGAEQFERANQAAQAVFTAMQAIPSGVGLVTIQDRSSMVALQESASELIKVGIESVQSAYRIKAEIETFERKLRAFGQRLKELNAEKIANALKERLEQEGQVLAERLKANFETRLENLKESEKRLRDLGDARRAVANTRNEIVGEEIVEVERRIDAVKASIQELERRRQALAREIEAQLVVVWRESTDYARSIEQVQALRTVIGEDEENFATIKAEVTKRYGDVVKLIEGRKELQQSRLAQVMVSLQQIEEGNLKEGLGVDWAPSRELALATFGDQSGFEVDLARSYALFSDARDEVNGLLFDYANALWAMTQRTDMLPYGAPARSHDEADAAHRAMSREFYDELVRYYGVKTRFLALRIPLDAAAKMVNAKGELPPCLYQNLDTPQDAPDRCLRIRVMPTPPIGERSLGSLKDDTLADVIGATPATGNAEVLVFDALPQNGGKAPELVFAPRVAGSTFRPRLMDVFLIHDDKRHFGLSRLRPVGPSTSACGGRVSRLVAADNPALDARSLNPAAPLTPFSAAGHIDALRRANDETSGEFSIRMLRTVTMQEAIGRGLGNLFEVRLDDPYSGQREKGKALPSIRMLLPKGEDMHLLIAYGSVNCDRREGVEGGEVEPFVTNVTRLEERLREGDDTPVLAERLVGFELSLARIEAARLRDATTKSRALERALAEAGDDAVRQQELREATAAATFTPDAADRLAALEALGDLMSQTAAQVAMNMDAEGTNAALAQDMAALSTIDDHWREIYLPAFTTITPPDGNSWQNRINTIVREELEGGGVSIDMATVLDNPVRYGAARRPVPLEAYEHVARLALAGESGLVDTLDGPLALAMQDALDDTDRLLTGMEPVFALQNRHDALQAVLESLRSEGNRRIDWTVALDAALNEHFIGLDPYVDVPELLCVAYAMEDQRYWRRVQFPNDVLKVGYEDALSEIVAFFNEKDLTALFEGTKTVDGSEAKTNSLSMRAACGKAMNTR